MPTALSTTKRKFHKILDSISNASSTNLSSQDKSNASTSTLPSNFESPAKKPRVARPTSSFIPPSARFPTSRVALNARPASAIATVKVVPSATIGNNKEAPNFAPWDRKLFLRRLETYRHVDKWMGKPDRISEVEWAKRGWVCVGKETVRCQGGCEKEIVIKLESAPEAKDAEDNNQQPDEDEREDEDDWREQAQDELVEKYAEMMTNAHETSCLWRTRGCDDTIYRLPLVHQATAFGDLQQRYTSLNAMASDLPPTLSLPEGMDISKITNLLTPMLSHDASNRSIPSPQNSEDKPTDETPTKAPAPSFNSSALTLALFGWQAEENHISGLATCTACFRRLGLWLFKSATDSADPSMNRLDVVGEHRDYCPWINAISQNGSADRRSSLEGLAGWEVLLRTVRASRSHRRDISPPKLVDDTGPVDVDGASEVGIIASPQAVAGDQASRDEKDKERWAKLKQLRQVFKVRKKTDGPKG